MLHTLEGKPNNSTDYPWCYDPLFMKEYQAGTGYKPAFQLDLENKEGSEHSDYVLKNLYGKLRLTQKLKKEKQEVAETLQKDSLI